MSKLQGKYVLITGASGGIGEAIAYQVAEQQGIPILVARSQEKLQKIASQITAGYQVKPIIRVVDITNFQEWEQILQGLIAELNRIDVLINNAGIGYFDRYTDMEWERIDHMVTLNNRSLFFTTYQLLPHMFEGTDAHIINIGSQAGKIATPKSAVYSATKASVISFSNALRMELDGKVRVTSVNIGPVSTSFFDTADPSGQYQQSVARYMLNPDDVATKVVQAIFTRKREVNLPAWMQAGSKLYQIVPRVVELFGKRLFNKK
ncbi:SDR family NAD(P)-dependent oxidoreductase [Gracilibacillus timonensis]|uniref:SDR family NAD(P)-dependent oxidoreductase n=1 Tax=Gracilibacillus timonensis TaxID=1816696 RepID=UPI000824752D|nr:SDR family oxidoreductase [Gracilibacillus timonensis]